MRGSRKERDGKAKKRDREEEGGKKTLCWSCIHAWGAPSNAYIWEGKGQVPDGVKGPGGLSTGSAVEGTEQLSHEDPCVGRVLEVQRLLPHDLPLFLDTGGKRRKSQ